MSVDCKYTLQWTEYIVYLYNSYLHNNIIAASICINTRDFPGILLLFHGRVLGIIIKTQPSPGTSSNAKFLTDPYLVPAYTYSFVRP